MTTSFTRYLSATLIGMVLLASCSRPVSYFQKSPVAYSTLANVQPVSVATLGQTAALSETSLTQVDVALNSVDTYVRNDRNLVEDKKLVRRLNRIKQLLAATHEHRLSAPGVATPKMSGVERLIIRKLNKRISHQLAPARPENAMISNRIQLIGGIVLLLGGLLLLILGTGTGAFIGLIIALIGALGTILGLFGG